jgi:hypothetical protein
MRLNALALAAVFTLFAVTSLAAPTGDALPACCAGDCNSGAMPCGMPPQPCCSNTGNSGHFQTFQSSSDNLKRAGSKNATSATALPAGRLVHSPPQWAGARTARRAALKYGLDSPAFLCVFLI